MKFIKSFLALLLITVIGFNTCTIQVMASDSISKVETKYVTINGDKIKLECYENETIVTTLKTGAVERIVPQDKYHVKYYDSTGDVHSITGDKSGNIYYDGKLYRKTTQNQIEVSEKSTLMSRKASTSPWGSGWKYLTSTKTEQAIYDTTAGIVITLLGFIPGLGYISGIAGITAGFISLTRPNAYYKIDQYVSTDNRKVRERVFVYSESNYTGYQGYHDTAPRNIF